MTEAPNKEEKKRGGWEDDAPMRCWQRGDAEGKGSKEGENLFEQATRTKTFFFACHGCLYLVAGAAALSGLRCPAPSGFALSCR